MTHKYIVNKKIVYMVNGGTSTEQLAFDVKRMKKKYTYSLYSLNNRLKV